MQNDLRSFLCEQKHTREIEREEKDTSKFQTRHDCTTSRLINERCSDQFTFTKIHQHEQHEQRFLFLASLLLLAPEYSKVGVQRGVPSLAPRKSEGFRENMIPLNNVKSFVRCSSFLFVVYIIEDRTHFACVCILFLRDSSGNMLRVA